MRQQLDVNLSLSDYQINNNSSFFLYKVNLIVRNIEITSVLVNVD